jgi:hypothetical protein
LRQWKTHREERKAIDASQAAITLALLLTDEELDSLEKIAGHRNRGALTDGRPRMDGVICWSGIRAVAKECDARPIS